MFIRGEEILSGAQRVHDPALLTKLAIQKGVPPESISSYVKQAVWVGASGRGRQCANKPIVAPYCTNPPRSGTSSRSSTARHRTAVAASAWSVWCVASRLPLRSPPSHHAQQLTQQHTCAIQVMLFLGLPNIRLASMFPRDPKRLAP